MDLPVVTCTGTTYERANIEAWWFGEGRATDPTTGVVIDNVHLVVNVQLYNAIHAWRRAHGVHDSTNSAPHTVAGGAFNEAAPTSENMPTENPPTENTPSRPVTMRTLMVDDGTQEAHAFCAAVEQLYARHTEQREAGLSYLVDNWKTFATPWLYCLLTSSAHLELLFMCADGVAADCRWRAVLLLQHLVWRAQ